MQTCNAGSVCITGIGAINEIIIWKKKETEKKKERLQRLAKKKTKADDVFYIAVPLLNVLYLEMCVSLSVFGKHGNV